MSNAFNLSDRFGHTSRLIDTGGHAMSGSFRGRQVQGLAGGCAFIRELVFFNERAKQIWSCNVEHDAKVTVIPAAPSLHGLRVDARGNHLIVIFEPSEAESFAGANELCAWIDAGIECYARPMPEA
jgi:hypothetical protein